MYSWWCLPGLITISPGRSTGTLETEPRLSTADLRGAAPRMLGPGSQPRAAPDHRQVALRGHGRWCHYVHVHCPPSSVIMTKLYHSGALECSYQGGCGGGPRPGHSALFVFSVDLNILAFVRIWIFLTIRSKLLLIRSQNTLDFSPSHANIVCHILPHIFI